MKELLYSAFAALEDFLEPLTEATRDRTQDFDCGDDGITAFLRRHVWRQQEKRLNRTYLVRHDPPDRCPGFISVSAAHIASDLTGLSRSQIVYREAPALLIARMGVDRRFQRKGVGGDLLAAARVVGQTLPAGCRFLVLHVDPTNTAAISLYEKEGFRVPTDYEPDESGLLLMLYDLGTTPR